MAVGQAASGASLDVAALDAVEARLEVRAVARCCEHAGLLRDVLALHRVHLQVGLEPTTVAQLALLLQVSEHVAERRLREALLLLSLPGGLQALECGLLSVEQSAVVLRAIGGLDLSVRLSVWRRLQARLLAGLEDGSVLPPARLSALLAAWVIAADPAGAQDRRRQADAGGDVGYRRRPDGLGDLFATAVPGPLLQAVLARIRDAARPWGSDDERTAGKRRLDALINLVLGRDTLPDGTSSAAAADDADAGVGGPGGPAGDDGSGRPCGARCGCHLDAPVPCGADVLVHVPLGAALGTTDELAELVGHGPLDPQQLTQLLAASPRLRAVFVDEHGVPRCEWPGCGVRAQCCDFEHDTAWPTGPSCACNSGPLCRHHHRLKQQPLFSKTRGAHSAVSWTDPTGRVWTSPAQHDTPVPPVRPLPATIPNEQHTLSLQELIELLAQPDLDPIQFELRMLDIDPDTPEHDLLADRLDTDTRWDLALDDPYRWAA